MGLWRNLLELMPGGRRPPTGPLTTAETADAAELQEETAAKERAERDRAEAPAGPDDES